MSSEIYSFRSDNYSTCVGMQLVFSCVFLFFVVKITYSFVCVHHKPKHLYNIMCSWLKTCIGPHYVARTSSHTCTHIHKHTYALHVPSQQCRKDTVPLQHYLQPSEGAPLNFNMFWSPPPWPRKLLAFCSHTKIQQLTQSIPILLPVLCAEKYYEFSTMCFCC